MTKKIDESQLIKDFEEGKLYTEIALKHKSSIGTIAYRLGKLGLERYKHLRRNKQFKEKFSAEEKDSIRGLMDTRRGRKQLIDILKDK